MKTTKLEYHRNGVSGHGFYVGIVRHEGRDMLVIRFTSADKEGNSSGLVLDREVGAVMCAAFDIDLLAQRNISFGENSWRGDYYSDAIDQAITDYHKAKGWIK